MNSEVVAALSRSAGAFRDVVWPVISGPLGGGELIPVESVAASGFAKDLDVLAGVDAWQVVKPVGMRALASRVQVGRWDTFSIRWTLRSGRPTEIEKRIEAIRDGYLYPAITVQAYLDCPHEPAGDLIVRDRDRCQVWTDHPLFSVAYIDTLRLYEFAARWRALHGDEPDLWKWRDGACVKDVWDGNRLLAIRWDHLLDVQVVAA